jgi:anhydro-N-acetylmuramic acid kinase
LLLNIGGIANVTRVVDTLEDVVALDTGPGNTLSDEIVTRWSGGSLLFDDGGEAAAAGAASERGADAFIASYDFFRAPAPKSTGKELFGVEAAARLAELTLGRRDIEGLPEKDVRDLLATAALVVGRSVGEAIARLPQAPSAPEMLVSGGGVRNRAIMDALASECGAVRVRPLGETGFDPDAKEAVGFAVLAHETLFGRAGNVPGATGASRPVVLGKIASGL